MTNKTDIKLLKEAITLLSRSHFFVSVFAENKYSPQSKDSLLNDIERFITKVGWLNDQE